MPLHKPNTASGISLYEFQMYDFVRGKPSRGLPTVRNETDAKTKFHDMQVFLASRLAREAAGSRSSAREKLTRLTGQQFLELSTDVHDELVRRTHNSSKNEVPFLPIRDDFNPIRNQARHNLATLPKNRFKDFCSDVFFELGHRYPELMPEQDRARREEQKRLEERRKKEEAKKKKKLEEDKKRREEVWIILERYIPRTRVTLSHVPILLPSGIEQVDVEGGFSAIFRGYVDNYAVALKTPRLFLDGDLKKRNMWLLREADLWRQVEHPHILEFLGLYAEDGKIYVITPWCSNGNSLDYIKANPNVDITKLLIEVADAVLYLHTFSPAIVHGDIKGENILIDDEGHALLCDFGLSRLEEIPLGVTVTATELAAAGTYPFMAPELFAEDEDEENSDKSDSTLKVHGGEPKDSRQWSKTVRSDVYAFGCLIYQMVTGERPFSGLTHFQIIVAVTRRRRPTRPKCFRDDRLWALSKTCWKHEAISRPSIQEVLITLRSFT